MTRLVINSLPMKTKTTTPLVPTSPAAVGSGFTLGLDLGDRAHHVCVLDAAGNIVRAAALPNTRPALAQLLQWALGGLPCVVPAAFVVTKFQHKIRR